MKSIDSINSNLGVSKVKFGNQDMGRTWKMRQEKPSKKYTTNWDDPLEIGDSV